MSLSLVQAPVKKIIVPSIDINQKKEYVIAKGAKENTWQRFDASNPNTSQVTVSCNPASREMIVSRHAYLQMELQLTFTGTVSAPGSFLLVAGLDAPRAYPLSRSLNTLQCTLNNAQFSVTLNRYLDAFLRYHQSKSKREHFYSTTPSMLDSYQEYTDQFNPQFGGQVKNPLAGYGESDQEPRGGFVYSFDPSAPNIANATTVKVNMVVTEPIFLSPFNGWSPDETSGFVQIQNMSVTGSFGEFATSFWSHDNLSAGHSTITALSATVNRFSVMLNQQTLPMDMPVPDKAVYPFFEIIPYSNEVKTIASGASQLLVLNSIQLKTIPRRMYIWASENPSDMLFSNGGLNKSNTFGVIENVNITFGNKVGLLSTASPIELYHIAVKNGCNLTWNQWYKYVGSVLVLDFSADLSLSELEASGLVGNYQFGLQALIRNSNVAALPFNAGRNINYVLNVCIVNEGTVSMVNGSMMQQIGVFSSSDVLNAPVDPSISWKATQNVYGGDFFSSIGHAFKKGYEGLKQLPFKPSSLLGVIPHPYAQFASQVGKAVGLGEGEGEGVYVGGKKPRKTRKRAGVLMEGGQLMSRDELRSRLE